MRRGIRGCVGTLLLVGAGMVAAACPPTGYPPGALGALRAGGFVVADPVVRESLALALLDCVGDPDPTLRDGLAFEGLTAWLRADALSPATVRSLHAGLLSQLRDPYDPQGFRRPFAALLLSEVARADRVTPVLDPAGRGAMVDAVVDYLNGLRDYRGFSEREGWRHGAAHAADLVLQLVVNTTIAPADVGRMLDALATRIAPTARVSWIHGEPERFARAVYFAHRRDALDDAWWDRWFDRVSSPAPLAAWGDALRSEVGLARRHNTRAFLLSLAHLARTGGGAGDAGLLSRVDAAIARVDQG